MHDIQKHILKKLSLSGKSKYSELKPAGLESNLFVYHLGALKKEGLVAAQNDKYGLTAKGKLHVDRVSFDTFRERIQPKIVTLIVLERPASRECLAAKGRAKVGAYTNTDSEFLLYRRRRAPFKDHVGFPYGKIHLEERIDEAALRELDEKTGLKADLRQRGIVYITVHDETELVSHMLCHIFTGKNISGNLRADTPIGECFWGSLESLPKQSLIPGVTQVAKLLKEHPGSKEFFFAEYFLNSAEE